MNKLIKILMVQTSNMNLGDTVIADNNYYLIKKAMGERECDILRYSISTRDISQIKYVDAVVFAAGIIKSTTEKLWLYIPEILHEANKHNVPVFMSGVGVEDFHEDDERSVNLKAALNLPCVKGISVRDDIDTLLKDYITNKDIAVSKVHDVAVWSKKTYENYLSDKNENEEIVGLGITREKLFADYGNPQINRHKQLDLWTGIISELDKRQIKWKLFTNGDTNDELFAREILSIVGHGEKLDAPLDAVTLVKNISTFSSVIAGRMHSNIISYALDIPSVGFIWNQKLKYWGERIGYPERFISCDDLCAENVIKAWDKAQKEGVKLEKEYRDGIYNALKNFVDNHCNYREKPHEHLNYSDTMVAAFLGGIDTRYSCTNSPQAFKYSLEHGYKNLQAEIRLTSDDVAVCVDRWHKDTFTIMNHKYKDSDKVSALSYSEFKDCKYYNRFNTMTLAQLFKLASNPLRKNQIKLVLSVGIPSKKTLKKLIRAIRLNLFKNLLSTKNLYIRLERDSDVEYVRKSGLNLEIIYRIADKHKSEEETLNTLESGLKYCKEHNIKYIYMNHSKYTKEFDRLCKEYGVFYYASSSTKTETLIESIKNGAFFVGNHLYDVDYLTRLTK